MCVYVYTRQKNSFRPTGPRFLGLQVRERGSESLHPFSKTTIYLAPLFQQETIDCFSLARFPTNGVHTGKPTLTSGSLGFQDMIKG